MTTPTAIDTSARVVARHEVDIKAPLARVWQLHIDVNSWPRWQQAITEAHMDGPFETDDGVRVSTNESFAATLSAPALAECRASWMTR